MTDQAQTAVETDAVTEALRTEQIRIEDRCIEIARDHGWCEEIDSALRAMFPAGPSWPNDADTFTHSEDGKNCRGNRVYDADGFNRLGFNRLGFNRDGYNAEGRDAQGFDRDGKDRQGIHRDSPERFRYNARGIDAEGYDTDCRDRYGYLRGSTPENLTTFDRDRDGYNRDGFNVDGYGRDGFNADGFDARGYNREGFDARGYDYNGRDRDGIDRQGLRRQPDGSSRLADLNRWQNYNGQSVRPADYGYAGETPEQAAEAEAYWHAAIRLKGGW